MIIAAIILGPIVFSAGFLAGNAYSIRSRSNFIHSLIAEEEAAAERDVVHADHILQSKAQDHA